MDADLVKAKYISLATYRRDGTSVATPVWFAVDANRLVIYSDADAGKVKRLRNNQQCTVAICDARGKVKGPEMHALGRLLPETEALRVHALLNEKYGFVKTAVEFGGRFGRKLRRKPEAAEGFIEIALVP